MLKQENGKASASLSAPVAKMPCLAASEKALWLGKRPIPARLGDRVSIPYPTAIPSRIGSHLLAQIISVMLVTGCAIKRDHYDVPLAPLPAQYRQSMASLVADGQGATGKRGESPAIMDSGAWLDEWWFSLKSPELNALIDQAIANNAELRIATLRVAQAQARAAQADGDQYPILKAPFEASHTDPANGLSSFTGLGQPFARDSYQASINGDWRVDIWGELSSMAESAEMQLQRATYQRDDARRTLIANVVSQYVEYLSLNDRIRVAKETETVLYGLLGSVSERVKAGDATVIDLEQQRSADLAVHAVIPGLLLQRDNILDSLAQLLGTTPGALPLSDEGIDSLTFPSVLSDVPATLLLRRPDIRAVEARLLAADADIDVMRARLLPPLSLSGKAGWGFFTMAPLMMQPYGPISTLVGNLTATVFDHGRRERDVDFARALHEELVETYAQAIYGAVHEVEDAIASIQLNGKRLDAQKGATDAALLAWKYSQESYDAGDIDFLKLLDTERTYHRNLDEYHARRMDRFKSVSSLFSALGGGVPQGGALPGDGNRPQGEASTLASVPASSSMPGIIWKESKDEEDFWLIELAGYQDRDGVGHAWRDLNHRFPQLMANRVVMPRFQGRVKNEKKEERATWFRVFIARFSSPEQAETTCGQLNAKQVRCQVVASNGKEFHALLEDEPPEVQAVAVAEQAASEAASPPSDPPQQVPAQSIGAAAMPLQKSPSTVAIKEDQAVSPFGAADQVATQRNSSTKAKSGYTIQLQSVDSLASAEDASAAWNRKGYKTHVAPLVGITGRVVYTVRTGFYANRGLAEAGIAAIRKRQKVDAFPIAVNRDEVDQVSSARMKPQDRG